MLDFRNGQQWMPAYAAGTPGSRALAQAQPQAPVQVIYQDTPFEKFMGSPSVALATDFALVGVAAFTAYQLSNLQKPTAWATVWWAIVTAGVIKGLHDYKRLTA